jgi:hypothetical protein
MNVIYVCVGTLLSKQLIWAKVAQHKVNAQVNAQEKLIMPKTDPSISSSNQYFSGKNLYEVQWVLFCCFFRPDQNYL